MPLAKQQQQGNGNRQRTKQMKKINVSSRKYDGRPRDQYEAFLYAENEAGFVVYTPPGTRDYDYRKRVWSAAPDGLVELYFKARWYTVCHICEQNSRVNQIYTHLSLPAVMTATGLEWVDLDLDYRVHLDGRLERLDEEEYQAHLVSMHYPADLQEQVQAACTEIEALYQQRVYPFNHAEQVALYRQIQLDAGPV
jgi:protein associated with RNAse G/E